MDRKWLYLIGFILLSESAGIIGSFFTIQSVQGWYLTLEKPDFNPPSWIFGPVWTSLYALMGVSAWLVFRSRSGEKRFALTLFGVQLALNAIWSIAFFGLQSPLLGLSVIIPLWLILSWTILRFDRIDGWAAILLVPYILWVTFATLLNYYIFILN